MAKSPENSSPCEWSEHHEHGRKSGHGRKAPAGQSSQPTDRVLRYLAPGPRINANSERRERDYASQYEYLVLSVSPRETIGEARQRIADHAEYGKWELQRSRIYSGGGRQFWLRRRVVRVERTA